jgi:hypothetical protein
MPFKIKAKSASTSRAGDEDDPLKGPWSSLLVAAYFLNSEEMRSVAKEKYWP